MLKRTLPSIIVAAVATQITIRCIMHGTVIAASIFGGTAVFFGLLAICVAVSFRR